MIEGFGDGPDHFDLGLISPVCAADFIERDESLGRAFGEAIPVLLSGGFEIARAPQTERSLRDTLIRHGLLPAVR